MACFETRDIFYTPDPCGFATFLSATWDEFLMLRVFGPRGAPGVDSLKEQKIEWPIVEMYTCCEE